MSELSTRMELLKNELGKMFPDRIVTRNFIDPAQRPTEEMRRGVYTLLSSGEGDYTNAPGYYARQGRQDITLVADIQVDESATPSKTEDAEFTMIDEIKAFVRNLPDTVCTFGLQSWVQSGQIAHPRGWVVFQMEYLP